jgi:Ca2+-binding RTX toxin-like protein
MTLEEHLKSIAKPQDTNTIEQTWQTESFQPFAWAAFDNSKTLAGHVRLDDPYFDGKLNYAFDGLHQVWYQIDGIDFDSDYTITVEGHYYNIYYNNPDSGQFDYVRTEFVELNDDNVLSLEFGAGNNKLITSTGHIKADLGEGDDTFLRMPRDNGLWSAEADLGEGDDIADLLGQGADEVKGGSGRDKIRGGGGNDTIDGGADDDQLYGEDGDDLIQGGNGDDYISAGAGDDTIDGGDGDDTLNAGLEMI